MRGILIAIIGLVVVLAGAGAYVWTTTPGETDADDTLVRRDEVPADFPLAPLTAAEGTLRDVTVRNLESMTTVTVQYELEVGANEGAILDRYAALMADQHGRPVRAGAQVRANVEKGTMAARIVEADGSRMLTLVAVRYESGD